MPSRKWFLILRSKSPEIGIRSRLAQLEHFENWRSGSVSALHEHLIKELLPAEKEVLRRLDSLRGMEWLLAGYWQFGAHPDCVPERQARRLELLTDPAYAMAAPSAPWLSLRPRRWFPASRVADWEGEALRSRGMLARDLLRQVYEGRLIIPEQSPRGEPGSIECEAQFLVDLKRLARSTAKGISLREQVELWQSETPWIPAGEREVLEASVPPAQSSKARVSRL